MIIQVMMTSLGDIGNCWVFFLAFTATLISFNVTSRVMVVISLYHVVIAPKVVQNEGVKRLNFLYCVCGSDALAFCMII